MADVFISYARDDKARADQIAEALQGAGFDVFWDSAIPPGQTWSDFIEAKLGACKAVIVLWSETSTKSQWVREEARVGRDRGKLIPARIDGAVAPFGFGEVQTADLSTWTGESEHPEWRRLLEAVGRALASPAAAAAPHASAHGQTQSGWTAPPRAAAAMPAASSASDPDATQVLVTYVLYLASIITGLTAIIGLVLAYIAKPKVPDWLQTHYTFLIRTFWVGLLYSVIGLILSPVGIGILILLAAVVWWVVRCVIGLDLLNRKQPIPNPRSWFLAT